MAITIKLDDVFNHGSTYLIDMNCKLDLLKYNRVIIKIEQDQELHFQQLEGTYKMKTDRRANQDQNYSVDVVA